MQGVHVRGVPDRDRAAPVLAHPCPTPAVAVEADFPDAFQANCYVRGMGDGATGATADATAHEALEAFKRFPTWMWRNEAVVEFLEWLRRRNAGLPDAQRCGFYGIDVYSLHASGRGGCARRLERCLRFAGRTG